jgi:amino acid permease
LLILRASPVHGVTIGYALDISDKAIAFSIYMAYWLPNTPPIIWISIFIILPLAFNLLNVRRFGDVEFTFTAVKVVTILGLIILGFVIAAGGVSKAPLLGTDIATGRPISCGANQTGCLSAPGFHCIISANLCIFTFRLARSWYQTRDRVRNQR